MKNLVILFLALMGAAPAQAHLTPNSEIQLVFGPDDVRADIIIPQGEYGYASGNPVQDDAASRAAAKAYLAARFVVTTPEGAAWRVDIGKVEFKQIEGPPDLHATALLTPPVGASPRALSLTWNAVIDVVPNHFALIVAQGDFGAGTVGHTREILGALQGERRVLAIDRGTPSLFAGFFAAIRLGMQHISEGYDHLLFLLTLLLPAPLIVSRARWGEAKSPRAALIGLAAIVTAFTIGHSLTLIGAAAFGWQLPAQPVEVAIALSILVSAVHAWRPVFAGREAFVAAGFGLIHGLAFASVIGDLGVGATEKALSIAGFNLGIELVQLIVVAVAMPLLVVLARTRWYPPVRMTGAALAGAAALYWTVERVVAF
jgi:HupE / UreJ protein